MKPVKMLLPLLLGNLLIHDATAVPNTGNAVDFTKSKSLHFIENKGQVVDQYHNPRHDIDFKIPTGNGLNIFIGTGKIHYQWTKHKTTTPSSRPQWRDLTITEGGSSAPLRSAQGDERVEMYRMDVTLLNANPNAEIIAEARQSYYEQYYVTHTGPDGATAHAYRKITYKEVYPHIDWVFYINDKGKLEHDFIVRPGGKVSDIRLQYDGADNLRCSSDGSVTAVTHFGSVTEGTPYCFQQDGKQIMGKFMLENHTLSFATAAHQGTLTIDPVLEWGTYFGGSGAYDMADAVTGDYMGNVYLTGFTLSADNIATTGAFQFTYAGSNQGANLGDAFLAKFNCDGTLSWSTYYGGAGGERGRAVSCDPYGNIYLAGYANNNSGNPTLNLATTGSHQDTSGGGSGDLFLVKFNTGGQRVWSTYYGGSAAEGTNTTGGTYYGFAVVCDDSGHVYLAGNTNSTAGIATAGSYQPTLAGEIDAFLVKFDSFGKRLWGTYYGGDKSERGHSVHVDKHGRVYLAGLTNSTGNIASAGTHQDTYGGGASDAYLAQFNSAGQLQWATYYGGSNTDEGHSVYCDTAGNVFFAGRTKSNDNIASPASFQEINKGGLWDAFLVKFDPAGNRQWGTFYGGINQASVFGFSAIKTDLAGNVYLAGIANPTDSIATPGSYQEEGAGGSDGFLAKFSGNGDRLWCTYYGGAAADALNSVYADPFGNVYTAGYTQSTTGIATANGYQGTHGGGTNSGFLVKFREDMSAIPRPDTILGHTIVCAGSTHTYSVPVMAGALSYTWTLPAGWTGSSTADSIHITVGSGTDTLRVSADFSCGSSTDRLLVITVIPEAAVTTNAATLCEGDSVLLQSSVSPGISWQWLRNDAAITGETDSVLFALQSGDYRVITKAGQCTDTSDVITVHTIPTPVITQNGNVLSTDPYYVSYQWYYGTQLITGATQSGYTYAAEGAYSVTVTDSNGCVGTSAAFTPVHIALFTTNNSIQIYPNPANSVVHIMAPVPVSVTVSSMEGKVILHSVQSDAINISDLADGVYLLRVVSIDGNIDHMEKLVKAGHFRD